MSKKEIVKNVSNLHWKASRSGAYSLGLNLKGRATRQATPSQK